MLFSNIFLVGGLLSIASAAPFTASRGDIFNAVEPRWGQKWLRTVDCLPEDAQRAGCLDGCIKYVSSGVVCTRNERAKQDQKQQMQSGTSSQAARK